MCAKLSAHRAGLSSQQIHDVVVFKERGVRSSLLDESTLDIGSAHDTSWPFPPEEPSEKRVRASAVIDLVFSRLLTGHSGLR